MGPTAHPAAMEPARAETPPPHPPLLRRGDRGLLARAEALRGTGGFGRGTRPETKDRGFHTPGPPWSLGAR
ncbi:hypothetical protein CSE45_1288 [Citreicella sp. SE45]|nr:hypothetical protein CSE45_1288 [Citreicella sp. SE45]